MTTIKIPDPPDHTDDGDDIPRAPAGSDLEQLFTLLEFCRLRDFRLLGPVQIGRIAVQVADMRQVEAMARENARDEGPWKEAGYDPTKT